MAAILTADTASWARSEETLMVAPRSSLLASQMGTVVRPVVAAIALPGRAPLTLSIAGGHSYGCPWKIH